jgi:hypothetical protein
VASLLPRSGLKVRRLVGFTCKVGCGAYADESEAHPDGWPRYAAARARACYRTRRR